jgi:hypothetical protein
MQKFTLIAALGMLLPLGAVAAVTPQSVSAAAQAVPSPAPTSLPTVGPVPIPSMTPVPAPAVSPLAPVAAPTPLPVAAPTAAPLPTPFLAPAGAVLPQPLTLGPDAPPQILAIQLSDPVFHSGELVSGTVITSTNVAAVQLRMGNTVIGIPRTTFGVFHMAYRLPHFSFFAYKTYHAQLVALNSAGVTAEQDLTIPIR